MENHHTPLNGRSAPSLSGLFTKSSAGGGQFGSAVPPLPLQTGWRCSQGLGLSSSEPPAAATFHPSEGDVAAVATAASNERIKRSAVVDSLRVATRPLDPAMAASVQSAALSQLQPDVRGCVAREEVARVWLMTVLPALERAPLRGPSGELITRRLTERLQRLLGSRLSQVMLDELPNAQEALGLSADAAGGGALPEGLVQPLVATLATAALRATVRELGDSVLALPGLESNAGGAPSQADAVGAAEALVRRMLEGALHGHHAALAQAAAAEEGKTAGGYVAGAHDDADGGGGLGGSRGGPASPTARELLRVREAQAALTELRSEHAALTSEHSSLLDEHEALLAAHRQIDAELEATQSAHATLREEHARLLDDQESVHDAASAEAATLERELHAARAAAEAEAAATAAAQRRNEHLTAEKAALEKERTALLGRVAAAEHAAAAAAEHAAAAASLADQRHVALGSYEEAAYGGGGFSPACSPRGGASPGAGRAMLAASLASPATAATRADPEDDDEDDEAALMAAAGMRVTVPKKASGGAAAQPSPPRSPSPRASSLPPIREHIHEDRPAPHANDKDESGWKPVYVNRDELRL